MFQSPVAFRISGRALISSRTLDVNPNCRPTVMFFFLPFFFDNGFVGNKGNAFWTGKSTRTTMFYHSSIASLLQPSGRNIFCKQYRTFDCVVWWVATWPHQTGQRSWRDRNVESFYPEKPTTCLLTNVPQNLLDFVYAARSRRTALRETRSNKWYFFRFKDSWPQHPSTLAQHQCVRGRLRHALLYLKSNCFCFMAALNLTNELEILIATRAIFKQVPAMIGHRTWGCQRTIFVTCARG